MSLYTSCFTLNNQIDIGGGVAYITNPVPWTRLGHLLYIDTRQTGFSYNLMNTADDERARFQEHGIEVE